MCDICKETKRCVWSIPGAVGCLMYEKLSEKEIKIRKINEIKDPIIRRLEAI